MKLLAAMPRMIEEEARMGALATLFLSLWSLLQIVLLRTAVLALRYFGETAVLAILLTTILKLPLLLTPLSWLIILLTLVGTAGIGLALTGLALVYKSVGPVVCHFSGDNAQVVCTQQPRWFAAKVPRQNLRPKCPPLL